MSLFTRTSPYDTEIGDYLAEFDHLYARDIPRLTRMQKYRDEAERSREPKLGGATESDLDYGRVKRTGEQERHDIRLPFAPVLSIKHTYRLAGRLPDATVERREETPQERYRSDTMEKIFWGVIRASGGATLFASSGWDGTQLGAKAYEVNWNAEKQMPIVRRLDPAGVIAVKGLHDPHDYECVYRYWTVTAETARATYRDKLFRGETIDVDRLQSDHKEGIGAKITIVERCDRQKTVRFAKCGPNGKRVVPLEEEVHGLGIVPRVIGPNVGPYEDVWGWGDYEFYREIAGYIPRLLSAEADIIRQVSNGTMISKSNVDPGKIERVLRQGGILPMKREDTLEPLETPETPAFQEAHTDRVFQLLKMLSFTPDAAWGDGAAGSGSDRGLQLQPQLELTALKQINEARTLTHLGEVIFRMIEKRQTKPSTYRGATYRAGVARGFKPFTLDPKAQAETMPNPDFGEDDDAVEITVPRSPKELFQGDYCIEFSWQNRVDPDDPAFVASELNKFAQGVQSARTTMERLGMQRPEDELKLITDEAEKYPWLRQGMIRLIQLQLAAEQNQGGGAQGLGGGAPPSQTGGLLDALATMDTKDGQALDADAMSGALPGGGAGQLYGGA